MREREPKRTKRPVDPSSACPVHHSPSRLRMRIVESTGNESSSCEPTKEGRGCVSSVRFLLRPTQALHCLLSPMMEREPTSS